MATSKNERSCGNCFDDITETKFYFRDHHGWICEECAPPLRNCKNDELGCTYKDFRDKCCKHELYFCEHSSKCGLCKETISEFSMLQHLLVAHDKEAYRTGTGWRAINGDEFFLLSKYGPFVIRYTVIQNVLLVNLLSSIPSVKLHKFKCTIELIDPIMNTKFPCPVEELYTEMNDWKLRAELRFVPDWSGVLDVCVNIAPHRFEF